MVEADSRIKQDTVNLFSYVNSILNYMKINANNLNAR